MHSIAVPPPSRPDRRLSALAALLIPVALATAQSIPNPSFEADAFATFPGYVSDNGPITGWTGAPDSNYGLNPAGSSPFADNGVVPNGTQVAFIQSTPETTSLETTISGLTAGQTYGLSFRANARSGNAPVLAVAVDGNSILNIGIIPVGAGKDYRYLGADFTAAGTSASLVLTNTAGGDNTVVVDDFSAAPSAWSYDAWTDDASSDIDPAHVYTHAYNFGSSASFIINEIAFTGVAGTNPSVPGKFSTTNLTGVFANDSNNLGEDSRNMANDFVYNGFPTTLTLNGLIPGRAYELTLFSVGWEAGGRWATFRSGTYQKTVDQDTFGDNNGIRFTYHYTADASGSVTVSTNPLQEASIHIYGITNREAVVTPAPAISSHPTGTAATIGETVMLSGSASGTRPITYKWFRNNVEIGGQTSQTLAVTVAGTADAAFYTFQANNGSGSATSNPAFIEVYEPLPAFNTGVDAGGAVLADGEIDPHYRLVINPDNDGVPDAFVQDSTLFPIVAGPWIANSDVSKWIGPRVETSGAAGPASPYVYETTFDLTGRAPECVITGNYSVDNTGTGIRVNGELVPGAALSTGFGGYTAFTIRSADLPPGSVISGLNSLGFETVNQGAGYTGLRVDGLKVLTVPPGVAPVIIAHPQGGNVTSGSAVTLSVKAYGTAVLSYQWTRNGADLPGATAAIYTIASFSQALNGNYAVRVTNGISSATSNPATLTASNVPPSIVGHPQSVTAGVGDTVSFTVTADGSPPFTYQWTFKGNDIPTATDPMLTLSSVTRQAAGDYAVRVSNAYGTAPSDPATLSVFNVVPGLYDTGVDAGGVALADGEADSHYILEVNADGDNGIAPIVHDSTVFPIVQGPWIANTGTSKWVGPRFDTSGAAGFNGDGGEGAGVYVYRINFDLTGFDPASVRLTGGWATDNSGLDVRINGQSTGLTNGAQFPVITPFAINAPSALFVAGPNTLDFVLRNEDANGGYTGLRVQNLRGLGNLVPALPTVTLILNASNQPVISFTGTEGKSYPIQRSTTLSTGGWAVIGTAVAGAGGQVQFTDTDPPVGQAYYRVVVPLQ